MNWMRDKTWREELKNLLQKPSVKKLGENIDEVYEGDVAIFPPRAEIFRAFELTPFDKVKVVIVGQDPYHTPGVACGLAFSTNPGVKIPPSLRNMFKEIHLEFCEHAHVEEGDLTPWSEQGVFLLNTILTVEEGKPASHHGLGWEEFTDEVLKALSNDREHLVFMLWGTHARKKAPLIDIKKHLVVEAAHPSPLSVRHGFFGCGHFKMANDYLVANGEAPITW